MYEDTIEEDRKTMTQETKQKMTTSERVNCSTWCTYNSDYTHLIALSRGAERTRRFPKQAELHASVISGQDRAESSHIGYRGAVDRW